MSALQCRVAAPADLETILPPMRDFNAHEQIKFHEPTIRAALARLLADAALGLVALFELEGSLAGYGVLTWGYDLEYGGRDTFITELYLLPGMRGRGLGKAALGHLQALAAAHGAKAIHLGVRPENTAAVKLYLAEGFGAVPRRYMTKEI